MKSAAPKIKQCANCGNRSCPGYEMNRDDGGGFEFYYIEFDDGRKCKAKSLHVEAGGQLELFDFN